MKKPKKAEVRTEKQPEPNHEELKDSDLEQINGGQNLYIDPNGKRTGGVGNKYIGETEKNRAGKPF